MDRQQFLECINASLLGCFPELSYYVAEQSSDTRDHWAALFEGIDVCDLEKAIQEVVNYEVKLPFHRDETMSLLHKLSREHLMSRHDERRRKADAEQIRTQADGPRGATLSDAIANRIQQYGLGPALREIESRTAAGENFATAQREVCDQVRRGER